MMRIKRRQYLVNKPVQIKYAGLVAVPLVILLSALYYLMYYAFFNQMLIPEAVATTLLPAMKKVNVVAVLALPVLLYMIVRMSLVYSNRIVGPIPRIERDLDKAIAGNYSLRLKARDKDALAPFIQKVNILLEELEKAQPKKEGSCRLK